MSRCTVPAALAALLVGTTASLAQIVTPVPPATPRAPEYVPPPPPPPAAPPPAAEAPVTAPDLVKKDAAGNIVEYTEPLEFVAVEALNLSADRKAKIDAVKASRGAMMDGTIIKYCNDALLIRSKLAGLDAMQFNDLIQLQRPLQALMLRPGLIDQLVKEGALRPNEADAARSALNNYMTARQNALKEKGGDNIMQVAAEASKMNIRANSREAMMGLEGMLQRLAEKRKMTVEEAAKALADADSEKQTSMLVSVARVMPMTIEPVKPTTAPQNPAGK